MDKTGGTLCYLPDRVCRSVVAEMVLQNNCIDHNLIWQIDPIEQESIIAADLHPPDSVTYSASFIRSVITNYFD